MNAEPMSTESTVDKSDLPASLDDLDTPALVVDARRLEANVARAADVADREGLLLRPHAKTHKSLYLARRQVACGAAGLTVSKLDELAVLRDAGAASYLLAYPVVTAAKAARLVSLVRTTPSTLQVGVDSVVGARVLSSAATAADTVVEVVIEVDCGLRRCGVRPEEAAALAEAIAHMPGLRLAGVFTHAGHSYRAGSAAELSRIAAAEAAAVRLAAEGIRSAGIPCPVVGVGSTPTFLTPADRTGVTETHPGNYIFLDRTQVALGVATLDQCALSVVATVVSVGSGRAVVDAGSKVFGLDQGAHGVSLLTGFGEDPDRGVVLSWLSEEHGVIVDPGTRLAVGDRLRFVPNHACVTANLAREMYLVEDDQVLRRITVDAPGGGH